MLSGLQSLNDALRQWSRSDAAHVLAGLAALARDGEFDRRAAAMQEVEATPYAAALDALTLEDLSEAFWLPLDRTPSDVSRALNRISFTEEFELATVRALRGRGGTQRAKVIADAMQCLREHKYEIAAHALICATEGVLDDWFLHHGHAIRDPIDGQIVLSQSTPADKRVVLRAATGKAKRALSIIGESRAVRAFERDAKLHNPARHGSLPHDPPSAAATAAFQLLGVAVALTEFDESKGLAS